MPSARRLLVITALTFLVAACTSAAEPDESSASSATAAVSSTTTSTSTPSTTATTTTSHGPPVDRLLVLDASGNIVTMDRNGESVEVLTDDAGPSTGYFQPTWSPDGRSVVVSQLAAGQFALVEYDIADGERTQLRLRNNAFYVHWSPRGDRVAYLSNGPTGIELAVAEFGEEPRSQPIATGAPLYFTWRPDGEELATLIGGTRFELRSLEPGSAVSEIALPGSFLNPAWTDAGLFYVTPAAGSDQLVIREPAGDAKVLARSPAAVIFTTTRSGTKVAAQAVGTIDGVSAAFQEAPQLPLNRLVVIDVATGELTPVTEEPVLAYFWDGAGEQLLVLEPDEAAQAFRWSVWTQGELRTLVDFRPAQLFVETLLPFFGQYALSTTMWSPDGTAFAFAGLVDGIGGIYVQNVAGGAPTRIADGGWVTWSPR